MSRPYTDILTIDNSKPVNNKSAVCSTTPTGQSSIRIVRQNYPVNLTIANIQSKYGYRFYNGVLVQLVGGQTIVGA